MESLSKPSRFGDYFLHAKIAQGGMADVFMATSSKTELTGSFVAIKKLLPHLNSNKAFVDLLIHEAKISVLLNHPGIAHVYDLGSYKSEFFIAMEYVHGKSLDRVLEKIASKKAPRPSLELATFIILDVLKALSFAHQLQDAKGRELNIIHRDVSPGNILLGYSGDIKLADFGIATAAGRLKAGFAQTAMGKLAYMAPEQAVNDPALRASDLYSLCVVYFELLTGQLPFQAENANQLLKKVIDGRMTDISVVGQNIPKGLRDIINIGLNKSSRKRFQTGPELFNHIVDFFKQERQTDFTAKATRDYYRKKLTEYLRLAFEQEVIHEIAIVQRTLASTSQIEEFKITAPQGISNHEFAEMEKTVVEADVSNEVTRHFPLTKAERERIMSGLRPEEAISTGTTGRIIDSSQMETDDLFDSPTVLNEEISADSSALRRISVRDALAKSSLNRHDKETLNQQLPAMEIVTLKALDEFERSTFSGNLQEDVETRSRNREALLQEIEEIRLSESKKKDQNSVSQVDPTRVSEATPRSTNSNVKSMSDRLSARKTQRVSPSKHKIAAILSLGLLAVIAASIYFGSSVLKLSFSPFATEGLHPTQNVYLRLVGEAQPDQQRRFKELVIDRNIQQVTEFFNLEFTRYTGEVKSVLQITASEPGVLISGLSQQANAARILSTPELFDFLNLSGFKRPPDSKVIYVYLYPSGSGKPSLQAFPKEYLGNTPSEIGAVFSPADDSQDFELSLYLARQIAKIFGASDKRDPSSGLPLNPEGLADPLLKPTFPQNKGELMAIGIPQSPLEKRSPQNLREIVIGPQTAYELGWIDRSKKSELMP
jgi:serine/threonine protein kinase